DVVQRVELAFRTARIVYLAQQAEQCIERSHGNLLALRFPRIDSDIRPAGNPLSCGRMHNSRRMLHFGLTSLGKYRALNSPGGMSEIVCKRCAAANYVKNGKVRALQRYRCKACGCNFTVTKPRGKPAALKTLALLVVWDGQRRLPHDRPAARRLACGRLRLDSDG